jgi:hypothetical protein
MILPGSITEMVLGRDRLKAFERVKQLAPSRFVILGRSRPKAVAETRGSMP